LAKVLYKHTVNTNIYVLYFTKYSFFFEIRVKNMLKTTERNTKVKRKPKRKTIKYYVKYIKYVK